MCTSTPGAVIHGSTVMH